MFLQTLCSLCSVATVICCFGSPLISTVSDLVHVFSLIPPVIPLHAVPCHPSPPYIFKELGWDPTTCKHVVCVCEHNRTRLRCLSSCWVLSSRTRSCSAGLEPGSRCVSPVLPAIDGGLSLCFLTVDESIQIVLEQTHVDT